VYFIQIKESRMNNIKTVNIFDKQVLIKANCCCETNKWLINKYPKLNLYIYINDMCNARCSFCNVYKKESNKSIINQIKLKEVLHELQNKNLLGRIAIAGGETTLDVNILNDTLKSIYETCGKNQIVTMNTNGYKLLEIRDMQYFNVLTGIHISRHHYNDENNRDIFQTSKIASLNDIITFQNSVKDKQLLRLNCNLVQGYIDNCTEIKKYLNMAGSLNIFRVGFVSLMPLNQFCIDNFVDFNSLNLEQEKELVGFGRTYDLDICECYNALYVSEVGKPIDTYFRKVKDLNCPYSRQLVYTNDNKLICGFNQEPIY